MSQLRWKSDNYKSYPRSHVHKCDVDTSLKLRTWQDRRTIHVLMTLFHASNPRSTALVNKAVTTRRYIKIQTNAARLMEVSDTQIDSDNFRNEIVHHVCEPFIAAERRIPDSLNSANQDLGWTRGLKIDSWERKSDQRNSQGKTSTRKDSSQIFRHRVCRRTVSGRGGTGGRGRRSESAEKHMINCICLDLLQIVPGIGHPKFGCYPLFLGRSLSFNFIPPLCVFWLYEWNVFLCLPC